MIKFEKVSKRFGSILALDSISLSLPKGKIIGLFGPNGAGKSTLLKMAAGIIYPSTGSVAVGEQSPKQARSLLAYLPEHNILPHHWTLNRAAEFYSTFFSDWDSARFTKQMAFLNLNGDMKFSQISRGQLAKTKLLLTLARKAHYILLDEPFSGIDISAREEITKALIRDYSEGQQTIIIATHEIDEIENLVEYIVFIDNGKVEMLGLADELRSQKGKSIVAIMKEAFRHGNK